MFYDWWVSELDPTTPAVLPLPRNSKSSHRFPKGGLPCGQLANSAVQNPRSDGAQTDTRQRRFQRGSVTIWGIGLTLIIAAFAGVVIDTWRVFAERQDLSGMADSAAIAAATAIDIAYLNETGEVRLDVAAAEERAAVYLVGQDGWSDEIDPAIEVAADLASITVVLEKDVDFTLLGPLLPGEDPMRITVTALASPNVVSP